MGKPLVSVLLRSYRHSKYIGYAIESVLNQTYQNIELLISDNGSNDGSREIIESYKDKRIKCNFFSHNKGSRENADACIAMATGKYYALLDSDDYWDLTKIEKQVEILENNADIGAVFTHVNVIDGNNNIIPESEHFFYNVFNKPNMSREQYVYRFFFSGNFLSGPSVLIHKYLFDDVYKKSLFLPYLSDFYHWTQLIKIKSFHIIQERLVFYRQHSGNISNPNNERTGILHYNDLKFIMSEFFDDMPRDLFYETFSDILIKRGELSDEELLCEVFFLHLRCNTNHTVAMEMLFSLRQNEAFIKTLLETYNFTWDDLMSLKSSIVTINTSEAVRLSTKFDRITDYLTNVCNKTAIFAGDADLASKLFKYLTDNNPACFSNVYCIICTTDDELNSPITVIEDTNNIPFATLEQAINDYKVNLIINSSYDFRKDLYDSIRIKHKCFSVKIVELFSAYEALCRL